MPKFKESDWQRSDKSVEIDGPNDFRFDVDYDDVNHFVVDQLIPVVIKYLNQIPEEEWQEAVKRGNIAAEKDELEWEQRWKS